MDSEWMDAFCGSKFWDANVTWNTDDPDLTPCVQRTLLIYLPCAFLWAFSPLEVFYILNNKNSDIPWNWLNCSKMALSSFLVALSVADLAYAVSRTTHSYAVYPVHYCTPIITAATMALVAVLQFYNKKRGLRTSGLLFMFWFCLALLGAVEFRYQIRAAQSDTPPDPYYFHISYILFYMVVLAQFILTFFIEAPPSKSLYSDVKNPCPEQAAPFPSRLFFSWFDGFIWTGYRRPLEKTDLWGLNPEDLTQEVVPKFCKHWDRTVRSKERKSQNATFHKRSGSVNITKAGDSKKLPSVLPAICRAFGPTFLFGSMLKLLGDVLTFASPQLLG